MDIKPYRVDVDQAVLDDLHDRLRRTRWVDVDAIRLDVHTASPGSAPGGPGGEA